MANKVLSIEIGQQTTKICEIDYQRKNPTVYHCLEFETPSGVIEDGYIRDKIAFATTLREQLALANIRNDKVVFTVSSTKIANREAIIPNVKENRIQDIVMANAADYFPVNIEEYNITYSILENINTKELKQIRLLVLAAPANLIKTYYELADIMKLNIVAIDYIGNSAYQLIKNQVNQGVNLVVQINDQNSIVNLLENTTLLIQRILPYGTITVAEELISNQVFNVGDYRSAMNLLRTSQILNPQFDSVESEQDLTVFSSMSEDYNQVILYENARNEVTSSLKNLIGNINRVIDYFMTKHSGKKIATLYITGEGTQMKGIEDIIRNEIGIDTKILNRLTNVSFQKMSLAVQELQTNYNCCIGATILPIDFTPKEYLVKSKSSSEMLFPVALLCVAIAGSIAIWVSSHFIYQDIEQKKIGLEEKITKIEDIEGVFQQYNQVKNDYLNIEAFDRMTQSQTEKLLDFIAELEKKFPHNTLATNITVQQAGVTITVTSDKKPTAAKLIEQLKTFESLGSVTVNSITNTEKEDGTSQIVYTVVCTYKN